MLNSFCGFYSLSRLCAFAPAKIASTQIIRSLSSDQMRLGACRLGHPKLSVLGRGMKLGPSPIVEGATCAMFILLGLKAKKLEEIVEWFNTKDVTPPDRSRMSTALSPSNSHQDFTKLEQPRKLVLLFEGLATSAAKLQSGFMIKLSPAQVKRPCVINRS